MYCWHTVRMAGSSISPWMALLSSANGTFTVIMGNLNVNCGYSAFWIFSSLWEYQSEAVAKGTTTSSTTFLTIIFSNVDVENNQSTCSIENCKHFLHPSMHVFEVKLGTGRNYFNLA